MAFIIMVAVMVRLDFIVEGKLTRRLRWVKAIDSKVDQGIAKMETELESGLSAVGFRIG